MSGPTQLWGGEATQPISPTQPFHHAGTDSFVMTCYIKCLNALGLPAKATRNGPLWALADGNEILKQFDHIMVPVPRDSLYTSGRYVVYTGDKHFVAVGVVGNMRVIGDDDDLEVLNDVALGNLVANNHVKVYELKKRDESIWGAGCWVPPWAVDSLGGGKRNAEEEVSHSEGSESGLGDEAACSSEGDPESGDEREGLASEVEDMKDDQDQDEFTEDSKFNFEENDMRHIA
jgi:hypothetical protein